MSKIALTPSATGTGVFTIASPATNTDRTLTLPDEAGTVLTSVSSLASANLTGAVTVSGANVGIGVVPESSYPDRPVVRVGSGLGLMCRATGNPSHTWINTNAYQDPSTADDKYIGTDEASQIKQVNGAFNFNIAASGAANSVITWNTAMAIDSSGNVLVGKTTDNFGTAGIALRGTVADFTRDGGTSINVNRLTSDGSLIIFHKAGNNVGSIGASGSAAYLVLNTTSGSGVGLFGSSNNGGCLLPANETGAAVDNVKDLGRSDIRWDDIYATNATIQTSDRNEKQDIDVLSEAETRVAVACKGLMRKFRWIDAVAEKGDDARIHFGIIAQDLQDAFAAEGLDAGRYAMFISSTWWETDRVVPAVEAVEGAEATYDDEGNQLTEAVEAVVAVAEHTVTDTYDTLEEAPEGATERTRLGVRYPELLAFIIGAL